MLRFFRENAMAIVWVIVVTFVVTMFAGSVFLGFSGGGEPAQEAPQRLETDRLVGMLGDVPVDRDLFSQNLNEIVNQYRLSRPFESPSPEVIELLQFEAFSRTLRFNVLVDGARDSGIEATKTDMKQILNSVYAQLKLDGKSALKKLLKERGVRYDDFLAAQEDDILVQKFAKYLRDQATVSDEDVDRKYSEVNVQHLLLMVPETVSENAILARISGIRDQISNGMDFSEAVRKYSVAVSNEAPEGRLGWISVGVHPVIEDAIYTTEVGQVSEPIRSPAGYHLFNILDKREKLRPLDLDYESEKQAILAAKQDQKIDDFVQARINDDEMVFFDPGLEAYYSKIRGEVDKAINGYQQMTSKSAASPLPHYYLYTVYVALGDRDKALAQLLKAEVKGELRPELDLAAVHMALAGFYHQSGQDVEKAAALDKAVELSANDVRLQEQMAGVLDEIGTSVQRARLKAMQDDLAVRIEEALAEAGVTSNLVE